MRELDLLLLGFMDNGYVSLDNDGKRHFESLLAYPDAVLFEWLMGHQIPSDREVAGLVQKIRDAVIP